MKSIVSVFAIAAITASWPAEASTHARHHHHPARTAPAYPDSVTRDGKVYKVCKPGMEDDCIQPRQAGLGFGDRPADRARRR